MLLCRCQEGLYIVLQRKAEGVDTSDDSYDRIINAARLGIHAGIGDIFESISSNGIKLDVKNFFDVYAELGLKSTSYETDIVSFSEGNLFDFSKDSSKCDWLNTNCWNKIWCRNSIQYK